MKYTNENSIVISRFKMNTRCERTEHNNYSAVEYSTQTIPYSKRNFLIACKEVKRLNQEARRLDNLTPAKYSFEII